MKTFQPEQFLTTARRLVSVGVIGVVACVISATAYGQFTVPPPQNDGHLGVSSMIDHFKHYELMSRSYGLIDSSALPGTGEAVEKQPVIKGEVIRIDGRNVMVRPRGKDKEEAAILEVEEHADVTLNHEPVKFKVLKKGDVARFVLEENDPVKVEKVEIARAQSVEPAIVLRTSADEFQPKTGNLRVANKPVTTEAAPSPAEDQSLEGGLGVVVTDSPNQGILILSVRPGSPAATDGLQSGDYLLELDGNKIDTPDDFLKLVKAQKPGDTVTIQMWRRGTPLTGTIKLTSQISARDANSVEGLALTIPHTFYDQRKSVVGNAKPRNR